MTTNLFVASIGNPAPYERTLHSAGHILLRALAEHLQCPPFQPEPRFSEGLTTQAILPNDHQTHITLWQSPSYMNVSGPRLVRSYKKWLARNAISSQLLPPPDMSSLPHYRKLDLAQSPELFRPRMRLVLVHDEMDVVPGRFQVRYGGAERSSRGHNGVKSVVDSLVDEGFLRPDKKDEAKLLRNKFKDKLKTAQKEAAKTNKSGEEKAVNEEKAEEEKDVADPLMPVLCRAQLGIGKQTDRLRTPTDYVLQHMEHSLYTRTCAQVDSLAQFLQKMGTSP